MKSLLLWGVETELSRAVARTLAVDGHRLLISGTSLEALEELDGNLVQSELHRFMAQPEANPTQPVSIWVSEQGVGLDGVLLFPPRSEANAALLLPQSVNGRVAEQGLFTPVELLRTVIPLLRKGKRPKRVLAVLEGPRPVPPSPGEPSWLQEVWVSLVPRLARELARDEIHLNLLCLGAVNDAALRETLSQDGASDEERARRLNELSATVPGGRLLCPNEAARLASMCFSTAYHGVSGQLLYHPNH